MKIFTNLKSDYVPYHNTYTSAVNGALQFAKNNGYDVDDEEVSELVGLQSQRPKPGKTTRVTIPLYKNGKLQRKALHFQVYNRETEIDPYELNMYIS